MGNWFPASDRTPECEGEPTPRVDRLEKDFTDKLANRLKTIETEFRKCQDDFRKCMKEVRKVEQEHTRYEEKIDELDREKRRLKCQKQKMSEQNHQLEGKVRSLEMREKALEDQVQTLQTMKEVQDNRTIHLERYNKEQEQKIAELKTTKEAQDNRTIQLERYNKEQEQKIAELKTQLSTSRDSRMRNRDIRPGDITHDHMKNDFVDYFNTSRSFFKPLGINNDPDKRSQLLITILQEAFSVCQEKAVMALADGFRPLLTPPKEPVTTMDLPTKSKVPEEWRYRREAFSILLSLSDIDPREQPSGITESVKQSLEESPAIQEFLSQSVDTVDELISKATKLAWEMVTLVPPAVLGTPNIRADQWQTLAHGSNESEDSCMIYRKPILFYSAWGDVGEKGEVKLVSNQKVLAQQTKSGAAEAVEPTQHTSFEQGLSPIMDGIDSAPVQVPIMPDDKPHIPGVIESEDPPSSPAGHSIHQPAKLEKYIQTKTELLLKQEDGATGESSPSASILSDASIPSDTQLDHGNGGHIGNTANVHPCSAKQTVDRKKKYSQNQSCIDTSPEEVDHTRYTTTLKIKCPSHLPSKPKLHVKKPPSSVPGKAVKVTSVPTNDGSTEHHQPIIPENQEKPVVETANLETFPNKSPLATSPLETGAAASSRERGSSGLSTSEVQNAALESTVINDKITCSSVSNNADVQHITEQLGEVPSKQQSTEPLPSMDQGATSRAAAQQQTATEPEENEEPPRKGMATEQPLISELDEHINPGKETGPSRIHSASHMTPEHCRTSLVNVEPSSGEDKTSLSEVCSSHQLHLLPQNGSDNRDGGMQPSAKQKKANRRRRSSQRSASAGKTFPCPAQIPDTPSKRVLQESTTDEASTSSANSPTLPKKSSPDLSRLDIDDVD